jgi:hypothetical protein
MLNAAQELLQSFFSTDVEPRGYKALHANRPTPPRPHFSRKGRCPKLFKGHRP